jgi:hypothetical protein
MSIGEIISTAQGLAVVTQVLPTQFKVGTQTLSQVVAAPLTGGGAPYSPPVESGTIAAIIAQLLAQQAAVNFVTAVVNAPLPQLSMPVTFPPMPEENTPGAPASVPTTAAPAPVPTVPAPLPAPSASAVARAYQIAQERSIQGGGWVVVAT